MSMSGAAFLLNGKRACCWPLKFMYEPGWMFEFAIQSGHFQGMPLCGTFNALITGCCSEIAWDVDGVGVGISADDHWCPTELDKGSSGLTTVEYCWCWWCELANNDGLLIKINQNKQQSTNVYISNIYRLRITCSIFG